MLKELYIESNIPIIFLTIIIICIVIYGYLEIKKINNRFDSINSKIDSLINKEENKDKNDINTVIMEDIMTHKRDIEEGEVEYDNFEKEEKLEQEYEEEAEVLLNNYNENNTEYVDEWKYNKNEKIIDLNVSPEENYKELIIQKINSNDNEEKMEIEEFSESENASEEQEKDSDIVDEIVNQMGEEKDVDYEGVSILNMDKDNDEEEKEDEQEEEIVIDERMSVNQLREICRELDLPQSGNKSKLIKRINEHK